MDHLEEKKQVFRRKELHMLKILYRCKPPFKIEKEFPGSIVASVDFLKTLHLGTGGISFEVLALGISEAGCA